MADGAPEAAAAGGGGGKSAAAAAGKQRRTLRFGRSKSSAAAAGVGSDAEAADTASGGGGGSGGGSGGACGGLLTERQAQLLRLLTAATCVHNVSGQRDRLVMGGESCSHVIFVWRHSGDVVSLTGLLSVNCLCCLQLFFL